MYIIIAGAGYVGYSLAKVLSFKHNVIIIDKNFEKLNNISEELDVLTVHGDIEDPQTYEKLDINEVSLYIAVTDSDESNLLSTLVVDDMIDIKSKIVRLKNDGFLNSNILKKLSIDFAVSPNLTTAKKVKALIEFPKLNNVKYFHQTTLKLASIRVDYGSEDSYLLKNVLRDKVKCIGVERDKKFEIIDDEFLLQKDDLLYLFGDIEQIREISSLLNKRLPDDIKKVVIFGANELSQKIAKELLHFKIEIKIVEKEKALCKEALQNLDGKVVVINSTYEEHHLFKDEGIDQADMVISTYLNDEKNIVKSIEAKEWGVKKVVAVNSDKDYYSLMHKLGLTVVRGTKAGTYYAILENISSSSIITQRHYCGGSAIMFIRKIFPSSKLIGKSIKEPASDSTKYFLIRDENLLSINNHILQKEDVVAAFGKTEKRDELEKWIWKL